MLNVKVWLTLGLAWTLLISLTAEAATFSTDFESQNVSTVQTIMISNNGLSITLTGGTAFRIGNGSLYHSGIKSWMLDPAGSTTRGTSTGTGLISFSENALSVDFYIRTENGSSGAQVVITDSTGAVLLDDSSTSNSAWNRINLAVNEGAALIRRIEVSATGTGMLAIDDFTYNTISNSDDETNMDQNTTGSGMSSGSGSISYAFLIFLIIFFRKIEHRTSLKYTRAIAV